MTRRKPPTADEIAAALARHDELAAGHALEWRKAVDFLRWELRTTPVNARDWLSQATTEESHPFELVGTSHGQVYYITRGQETQTLHQAGYATDDSDTWPFLTNAGEPVYGKATRYRTNFSASREFVVLTDTLCKMCAQAKEAVAEQRTIARTIHAKSREVIEEKHGRSLDQIRGLLRAAGVDTDQIETGSNHNFETGQTVLSLILLDDVIDRVAEVLSAHGIESDPPAQIVTRKPANT